MRHEAIAPFRLPGLIRGAIAQQTLRSGSALAVTQDQQIQDLKDFDYAGNANKAIIVDPAETGITTSPVAASSATSVTATEALTLGDLCNIYTSGGAARVRKANATDTSKPANAFVTANTANGAAAPLLFVGQVITGLSGLTPGATYWLSTTGGAVQTPPPTADGNGVQEVGVALSATTLLFQPKPMIGL